MRNGTYEYRAYTYLVVPQPPQNDMSQHFITAVEYANATPSSVCQTKVVLTSLQDSLMTTSTKLLIF
jgi:hypothetical protein